MNEEIKTNARKNQSILLQFLGRIGQVNVTKRLNKSETTISNWKNGEGEIEKVSIILAALDLKCVPLNVMCYDAKKLEAIFTLAQAHMASMRSAESLSFDDDPE